MGIANAETIWHSIGLESKMRSWFCVLHDHMIIEKDSIFQLSCLNICADFSSVIFWIATGRVKGREWWWHGFQLVRLKSSTFWWNRSLLDQLEPFETTFSFLEILLYFQIQLIKTIDMTLSNLNEDLSFSLCSLFYVMPLIIVLIYYHLQPIVVFFLNLAYILRSDNILFGQRSDLLFLDPRSTEVHLGSAATAPTSLQVPAQRNNHVSA